MTTARDPQGERDNQFGYAELIEAGRMIGPRLFSVGKGFSTTFATIESLEEARALVRHRKAMGAVAVKQYDQPTRRQRQWFLLAAKEAGLNVTNHGGDAQLDLTMVLDGFTGIEHNMQEANLFGDVTRLIAEAQTWYTPTLLVSTPWQLEGTRGGHYFFDRYRMHDDPKYRRFVPHQEIDRYMRGGYRQRTADDGHWVDASQQTAAILHQGGHVAMGSHASPDGLAPHWELWALQMGGLSNHEALRAATLLGAEGLGMQQDLGSLEAGKLADLLVLDRNPLEKIENSLAIRYVMKNGELYDGNTLDTLWPRKRRFPVWQYPNDETAAAERDS